MSDTTNDETTEAPRHHQACQDRDGHPAGATPCPLKRAGVLAAQLEQMEENRDIWEGKARRLLREVEELRTQLAMTGDERRQHMADLLAQTVAERDRAQHQLDDVKGQLASQVEAELVEPLRAVFPDDFVPAETQETGEEHEEWDEGAEEWVTESYPVVTRWRLAPGVTTDQLIEKMAGLVKVAQRELKEARKELVHLKGQYTQSVEERARLNLAFKGMRQVRVPKGTELLVVGVPGLDKPALIRIPDQEQG